MAHNEQRGDSIRRVIRCWSLLCVLLILAVSGLFAKQRKAKTHAAAPQDKIEVVAHVPSAQGTITRLLITEHYGRNYLYAQHRAGSTVTLMDVTDMNRPAVLANVSYPIGGPAQVMAVTGNAALIASTDSVAQTEALPQTFRIMSFADPSHPIVKQEFAGVTAMCTDDRRALIFLGNPQGVWILQQQHATDPQEEKEWEHMMLDNR